MALLEAVIIALALCQHGNGWAFTDVRYNPEWRQDDPQTDPRARLADDTHINSIQEVNELDTNELSAFPQERISLIFPGTKWCGAGNVASDYDDLGTEADTDRCCRDHDNCPDLIESGDTKHNLTNNAYYTRLNCSCDDKFLQCLRAANTKTSRRVGLLYFDAIGTECFREDYPVTGCKRRGGFLKRKCLEYDYNTTGEPLYQWFDVPQY